MGQYGVLLYAPAPGTSECEPERVNHFQDLVDPHTVVAAFDLTSAETATSLRGDLLIDGPFIESKEVVVGFHVIDAPDLDAALEIARRNPILGQGGGLEIRPVMSGTIAGP